MECGLLVGDGEFRRLTVQEAESYRGPGFVWLHLHGWDEEDFALLRRQDFIPDVAASALVATETRPRCDRIEAGAIVNLRGPGDFDPNDSDRLVSIRLWVHHNRVTSVSRRRMSATAQVMAEMEAGKITDPGDLVAAYARQISTELDPQVAGLGDCLDEIESGLEEAKSLFRHRTTITKARSDAISFRRFVAPDRDALLALAAMDFEWLSEDDRLHIREAADKFARMAEELEAVRERAGLLHEQLTDLRAEQLGQRGFELSVVAFIFLPLTFITGLLGMNVEGIPYAQHPLAFWAVVGFCLALAVLVAIYFTWRHWLRSPS
jgi:zinc transporter